MKKIKRRSILLTVMAFVLSFALTIIGIIIAKTMAPAAITTAKIGLAISVTLDAVAITISIIANKRYQKKYNDMTVTEIQNHITSHRESTEDFIKTKLKFLRKCRIFTDFYAVLFLFLGIIIGLCCGMSYSGSCILFWYISSFCFLCSFSRIRFPLPSEIFNKDVGYVSEKEYPRLYALVYKAANQLNCSGQICIAFTDDFNAGIAKVGKIYSVQIGILLLNTLSEEELYSVLLHEFGHMVHENTYYNQKEYNYNTWLSGNGTVFFLSTLTQLPYLFLNAVYSLNYSLYLYSISIQVEHFADNMMLQHCKPQYAASALLKTKYFNLHAWEQSETDSECIFQPEQLVSSFTAQKIQNFKEAIQTRAFYWNQLIDNEILSRSASHPTFKMRMNTLNIRQYSICESEDSDAYKAECLKAVEYIDQLIYEQHVDNYAQIRKDFYLDPKELVDAWIVSGSPIIPEEYMDVVSALRQLGRISEANTLCDAAISQLDDIASCHAYFMKGASLLHSYDPAGIDYIYHAIENNNNYIMEGLDIIGEFCCIVGREDDLQIYREKVLELAQRHKDVYSEYSVLSKSDHLIADALPEQLFNDTLSFILNAGHDLIEDIFLVRKIVTDQDFTSAYIIRFEASVDFSTLF